MGLTFVAHFVTCGSHLLLFFLANIFRWNPIVSGFQRGMFANGSLWTNLCCREGKRKANIIFLPRCCLAPCYESNHNHRSRFILSQRCFSSSCQFLLYQYFSNLYIKCNLSCQRGLSSTHDKKIPTEMEVAPRYWNGRERMTG